MSPQTVTLTQEHRILFRERREFEGLTQEDVPGVSTRTVRSIEQGYADRFSVGKVADLAIALEFTPEEISRLGLPQVANRMRTQLRRRDEYAAELLRSMRRNSRGL